MSDYSEHGAEPVEDAAVDDPPTVSEVRESQQRKYPDQAETARHGDPTTGLDPEDVDAEDVDSEDDAESD